jgi:hypothetical protein
VRTTAAVLGLVLGIPMAYLTIVVAALRHISLALPLRQFQFGAVTIPIVLGGLWLLAILLVNPVPLVSVVLFGGALLLGVLFGLLLALPTLLVWGAASGVLALLSFFGWLEQHNAVRRERERRARLANPFATLGGSVSPIDGTIAPLESPANCAFCGAPMEAGVRYCSQCGAARGRSGQPGA